MTVYLYLFLHPWDALSLCCRCFKKFRNIQRETPVLESLFDKVTGLAFKFIKKRLQDGCFPVNIEKSLRILTLKNFCKPLLLNVFGHVSGDYKNVVCLFKQVKV